MMQPAVLVTDGEQRSALAAVRALGARGHRVYVCSQSGRSLAGASRYAVRDCPVPSALDSPDRFAAALRALVSELAVEVLLPMTEQSFLAIFDNPALFAGVCIPAAGATEFRAISDKRQVLDAARACGIGIPEQVVLHSPSDVRLLADQAPPFPLVVKPARSVATDGAGSKLKLGVKHCADRAALDAVLATMPEAAYPLLLQQRIVGPGVGIFLLLWDDELVATFAHRRLREKPPSGGVSVYRESIAADPTLVARSRALLQQFGWRGVAMVEYKIDSATGTPYLMEINGRFWGSLQLAIDAGVDFPSLLVARAGGQRVYGPANYRLGVRSRWEWGEVDHLLARLRRSNAGLSLPPGAPPRIRAILESVVPWHAGDRLEVFRFIDPAPFVRETLQYFHRS